ncbi:XRE family transcriptional regulator [Dysgonomonas sp. 521]|uniref:helix-turn-helix domain-containing protein n=1 Tax=Dysgonomonas sp. 521 TaxID=2302932 RepID=UPI0013D32800|nr:helix-turn-helix transcriptional regulator [Dysgonomonas sp. 521]NDV93482.1 XRE family transcriptional regulator [Dysgonomonas sp. 521]
MSLRIKEVLKEKGYTIQSLSEVMGVNRVSLTNSINGNPTVETLEKIASTIGVDISELFISDGIMGIIRAKGITYEINSIEDLKKILAEIESVK